jgi:dTDP-4-amino-4,6-dideoxygalactose transaminase
LQCDPEDHSWYLFMVLIELEKTRNGVDRNRFISELAKRDIGTSVHYKPLHRMTYYRERYGLKPQMFPNAEWVYQRCVSLSMFSAMTEQQLEYVIETVRTVLG